MVSIMRNLASLDFIFRSAQQAAQSPDDAIVCRCGAIMDRLLNFIHCIDDFRNCEGVTRLGK
jgi:hypothetical protein